MVPFGSGVAIRIVSAASGAAFIGVLLGGGLSNRSDVPHAWHGIAPTAPINAASERRGELLLPKGRRKVRRVSDTPAGIAQAGKAVRDLLAHYTNQRNMKEGPVGLLLYGYLVAKLGAARVRREYDVETLTVARKQGRPEQIDFVVGRTRHSTGEFEASTVIEFAVRRNGQKTGADPGPNLPEIVKLAKAEARHRILLLLDLTPDNVGSDVVGKYRDRGYARGRPRGGSSDSIIVIYVGEYGTRRAKLKRQPLRPRKPKAT